MVVAGSVIEHMSEISTCTLHCENRINGTLCVNMCVCETHTCIYVKGQCTCFCLVPEQRDT